jgi:hypothetical protein
MDVRFVAHPYRLPFAVTAALLLAAAGLPAQESQESATGTAGPAIENSTIFEPLDLPDPNAYRTGSGRPGPEYWQQSVDYEIDVRLHPDSQVVRGSETIRYVNHSPDRLEYLWLQLDQNLFDPSSEGAAIAKPDSRFRGAFSGGGYTISNVEVHQNGETAEAGHLIDGTVMRITLPEPVPAEGGRLEVSLDFRFEVPDFGADRMARMDVEEGTVYQLAQWYPRVFTYDDAHGWNVMPYLGQGEFYLEFGSFDVSVTVPREYLVVATGTLENAGEVLTPTQRERLDRARNSADPVTIVGEEEVGDPSTRPSGDGPLTWHFRAEDVRDFSWAASQAFIWDAASWQDVLIMSVYPREGLGGDQELGWENSTRFVRHAVSFYSRWEEYPYPVAINVAGEVGGMEYPMIMFCSVDARGRGLFGVTDHEFGHTWFPMLVGSDERRWFWMDEGLNTFMNLYSSRALVGADSTVADSAVMAQVARSMEENRDGLPILTYTDRVPPESFGYLGYSKPAFGLVLLREYVLGRERFDAAFREYIDRWKHRHPTPADFFRTIEDVAGEDLDWFWQGWFNGTGVVDQAISEVRASGDTTRVTLEQAGDVILPARVRLEYSDGRTETRRFPVEAWHTSDRFTFMTAEGTVRAVRIDPGNQLPDVDRTNNSWRTEDTGTTGTERP